MKQGLPPALASRPWNWKVGTLQEGHENLIHFMIKSNEFLRRTSLKAAHGHPRSLSMACVAKSAS